MKLLVTDFDGTMTQHDFYRLAIESLVPIETPDNWSEYRAGRILREEGCYTVLSTRDVVHEGEKILCQDPRLARCFVP